MARHGERAIAWKNMRVALPSRCGKGRMVVLSGGDARRRLHGEENDE